MTTVWASDVPGWLKFGICFYFGYGLAAFVRDVVRLARLV